MTDSPPPEYQTQAEKWDVVAAGHLLRVTLPVYARHVDLLINYAAANAGMAAAVRWVAERDGSEAADELTRHILQSARDAVAATCDTVNLVESLEAELKRRS